MAMRDEKSYLNETDKLIESFKEEPESEGKREKGYLRTLRGIIGTFVSVLMAAMSVTTVQLLERRIPDLELNTYRFALPLVFSSISILLKRVNPCMSREDMKQTLVYCVASFMSSFFYYVSVTLLPAATASCIMYTTNVLGCFVLFFLFHNEKIRLTTVFSAVICITGLVMVLQPGFADKIPTFDATTTKSETTESATHFPGYQTEIMLQNISARDTSITHFRVTGSEYVRNSRGILTRFEEIIQPTSLIGQIIGYSFAVVSGLGFAWSILILKQYNFPKGNLLKILFWLFFVNSLISILLTFIFETIVLPSNWFDFTMATIHCVSASVLWLLYCTTSKYISGPLIGVICTTEVVVMLISQYTVLSSILPGHRNWMEVVGVILVMLGCSMSSLVEIITSKETEQ